MYYSSMDQPNPPDKTGSLKKKSSITSSPYVKKRIHGLIEDGEFSSESEFYLCAAMYFIGRLDLRSEHRNFRMQKIELNNLKKEKEEKIKMDQAATDSSLSQ